MVRLGLFVIAPVLVVLTPTSTDAEPSAREFRVGDTYEITLTRDSSQQGSDGSSGSSHDQDTLVERVVGVRGDGVELEYDLPKAAAPEERASDWKFPAHVLKPAHGPLELLDRPAVEARLDAWLKAAGWTRTVCGHWIFTWNAFRIECDLQSVIETIEAFDLTSADLRDGAAYQEPGARGPGRWARKAAGAKGVTFAVMLEIDPDGARQARAESDVALGEIMRKPVTLDAALRARTKESVSGTILVEYDTDAAGEVLRRRKVTKLTTKAADGTTEIKTTKETVERRLVSGPSVHR